MKVKAKTDFFLNNMLVKAGTVIDIDDEVIEKCKAADVIEPCKEDEGIDGTKTDTTVSTGTPNTGTGKETSKNRRK